MRAGPRPCGRRCRLFASLRGATVLGLGSVVAAGNWRFAFDFNVGRVLAASGLREFRNALALKKQITKRSVEDNGV